MSMFSDFAYRLFLRSTQSGAGWHNRFFRPGVTVVEGSETVWFEENGKVIEAQPAGSFRRRFSGRCNLLLSGPSVRSIVNPERITTSDWIGVNGSPALFEDEIPRMRFYHVNDPGFVRTSSDRFLKYAMRADFTLIDFRSIYELLAMEAELPSEVRIVVFDSWAWPFRKAKGAVERLTKAPENRGVHLSTDLGVGLAQGGTVAYTAAQFAWMAGYESLFMYGLDLSGTGRFYKEDSPQPQMLDKAFEKAILPAFELLVRESGGSGFKLFNCNPDSRLPSSVISHIDPDASFEGDFQDA